MLRRTFLVAAALAVSAAFIPLSASAGEILKFSPAAFTEAQKAGKSILIDVHAPWCSTCKAQRAVLNELLKKPELKDIVLLEIDFDTQKDDWKALGAQARSTLIAFKGEKETGRLAGDTKMESIETLLKSAL